MNRKQAIILLTLVVVVGGAGLLLWKNQRESYTGGGALAGKPLMPNLPVNDVAQISLRQGTNQLNLVRKDDLWRVAERNNYPASYAEVSGLLLKMRELKPVQTEEVGPSLLHRLGLASEGTNAAMVLELKGQEGKPIQSLLVGKKHLGKSNRPAPFGDMGDGGFPNGRYLKLGSGNTVVLINDPLNDLEPRAEAWLDKDFFKVEKVKAIEVALAEGNGWKLTRTNETAEWQLANPQPGEQLDNAKVSGFGNALSYPSFNDVAVNVQPFHLGLDKPSTVRLETFDGFSYHLKLGSKTNDHLPLMVSVSAQLPKDRTAAQDEKPEDKTRLDKEFADSTKKLQEKLAQEKRLEGWIYLVSPWSFENLLKPQAELMVEKKEETNSVPAQVSEPVAVPGNEN